MGRQLRLYDSADDSKVYVTLNAWHVPCETTSARWPCRVTNARQRRGMLNAPFLWDDPPVASCHGRVGFRACDGTAGHGSGYDQGWYSPLALRHDGHQRNHAEGHDAVPDR